MHNQMSATHINILLDLWAVSLLEAGRCPLFSDYKQMYNTIDSTQLGDVKWQSFTVKYTGDPGVDAVPWMHDNYNVWFQDPREVVCNMLANPGFVDAMNYQLFCEYDTKTSTWWWQDFMSGDWAWWQAVSKGISFIHPLSNLRLQDIIAQDPDCLGLTFILIILGSDKTTMSVATGQNDYYPLYLSIGNIHNNVHHAHRNGVVLIGFLAMPKSMHVLIQMDWYPTHCIATREHASKANFQLFCQQLFHSSLGHILKSLKPGMSKPEVVPFGDGHHWCVIYGLGPYIANYEEQALLTCIVHNWCPWYV